jgi:hypothetical protein
MWFDSTDGNIQVQGARDSHRVNSRPDTRPGNSGQLRVCCNVDAKLKPGEVYWLQVEYEQAEYFHRLPRSGSWLVNDWLARCGTINSDPYTVGEPQRFSLTVHVPDIRWGAFGIKDPTKVLEVDTNRVGSKQHTSAGVCLQWQMNLRPDERSREIYILYHVKPRWKLLTPLVWAIGVAIGAVSVEVLWVLLWGG